MPEDVVLPTKLDSLHKRIRSKFAAIQRAWEQTGTGEMPLDEKFALQIIDFIIETLDYMIKHYTTLNLKSWIRFLYTYYHEFYYGPNADDYDYLDFHNRFSPSSIFLGEMNDWHRRPPNEEKLRHIRQKFARVRENLAQS